MKKKNFFLSMLAIAMVSMLSVCIASCGGDDKDDGGGSNAVTGTWVGQGLGEDNDEKATIVFRSDLTGTFALSYYNSHYGNETQTATFTYTVNEDKTGVMLMKFDDYSSSSSSGGHSSGSGGGNDTFYFWFDGDKLCVNDQPNGTPEWVLTKQ